MPHPPQPGISRLRAFPVGMVARKWRSFSLRSDCVITYPVFLILQTRRAQICPYTLGLLKAHTLVESSSASVISRDVGAGGGWPCAALSRCPGLPCETSTRATAEGSGKRDGSQGGGRQKSGKRGTLPPIPTRSRVWADTASGGLQRINEPCGFSGPGFTVAAPGHPSPPLRSSAPTAQAGRPSPLAEGLRRGLGQGV